MLGRVFIPKILQKAMFELLLFSPKARLKTRNRVDYYSLLIGPWTKKSNRPKHSFLKNLGYILCLGIACSSSAWSFKCYLTLAKDSCWGRYEVSVDVIDSATSAVLTTVVVPAGKLWVRAIFTCQASQKLNYKARFTPSFWDSEKGLVYPAINYLSLPARANPGDKAWNISICFPGDFSEIPSPPDATGNCQCDFSSIPELKPE